MSWPKNGSGSPNESAMVIVSISSYALGRSWKSVGRRKCGVSAERGRLYRRSVVSKSDGMTCSRLDDVATAFMSLTIDSISVGPR